MTNPPPCQQRRRAARGEARFATSMAKTIIDALAKKEELYSKRNVALNTIVVSPKKGAMPTWQRMASTTSQKWVKRAGKPRKSDWVQTSIGVLGRWEEPPENRKRRNRREWAGTSISC